MCIAYLALATDPQWPLFIAANRDEFHQRPTRAAAPWPDYPHIIGGLDLQAGGTWFAVSTQGRFALLTNFRDMFPATGLEKSRGELPKQFLIQTLSAQDYIQQVAEQGHLYQGFNLIVGQWHAQKAEFECYYYSNRNDTQPQALAPGNYVLSNHLLNTPWPKSQRLCERLQHYLSAQTPASISEVYAILRDEQKAEDHLLPQTGLSLERERLLSSPFIISPDYGTRSSTVWQVSQSGHSFFHECSYNPQGKETERHSWPLLL